MQEQILRKIFLGFIHIHILHHAKKEPFYGSWMIEELKSHGYDISPGTLYPILKAMEQSDLINKEEIVVGGKVRKYYKITPDGELVLKESKIKAKELFKELE
ncbi:PadR family transcriptional regulator [Paraclostridium bifermentans]|uniref:Transcriptional regulator PadR-like family protein n=1 Tax=Paraclostridium bifermentans ATCC 638 = DSM 14991 TaxID=1233171 RepID=T4VL00_PARBF|nr:PadR family transcriptional regulator [Paraclostridium bifermentans]EQK42153.1 transcriptional regulator PadR-like family protein [[Clostridium] bifermentans ATCC 638] [Paraclostridium bifermentans ATCC 638 = DSM 14991]MBS5952189.1 helix-turn-helix transcriptional regulator [Paraclostridium bifermentans]MBU5287583.1 PadR family transcriptional regulator [Paraclostridium bifermentans]MDU3335349.1 PadR family transcriptional regulator [Paraclostridium bifermentans]RIZ58908.1 PadR family trans